MKLKKKKLFSTKAKIKNKDFNFNMFKDIKSFVKYLYEEYEELMMDLAKSPDEK